jgi:hypothetical protein
MKARLGQNVLVKIGHDTYVGIVIKYIKRENGDNSVGVAIMRETYNDKVEMDLKFFPEQSLSLIDPDVYIP